MYTYSRKFDTCIKQAYFNHFSRALHLRNRFDNKDVNRQFFQVTDKLQVWHV